MRQKRLWMAAENVKIAQSLSGTVLQTRRVYWRNLEMQPTKPSQTEQSTKGSTMRPSTALTPGQLKAKETMEKVLSGMTKTLAKTRTLGNQNTP
jgi:hypothetical protein